MTLLTIPLRCAKARWLRTMLLVAVFTLGVASLTGLRQISAIVGESFERQLISYGANILITPKKETLTINYGGHIMGDVALNAPWIPISSVRDGIDTMRLRDHIAVIAPKVLASALYNEHLIGIVGISWDEELSLKGYWEAEGEMPYAHPGLGGMKNDFNPEGLIPNDAEVALVGAALADRLGLSPGQTFELAGTRVRISGVLLPTGSDDDTVMFVSLPFAEKLSGREDEAAFFEVAALCSGCPIDEIVAELQTLMPHAEVKALRQVAQSRMYAVHFTQSLALSISLVILVFACAMIIMSTLSAVTERRREIGLMRAVGFSRKSVFRLFMAEAFGIGALSGILGYLLGFELSGHVLAYLHPGSTVPFSFFELGASSVLVGLMAGMAAAFPAFKATMVEPAEALVAL